MDIGAVVLSGFSSSTLPHSPRLPAIVSAPVSLVIGIHAFSGRTQNQSKQGATTCVASVILVVTPLAPHNKEIVSVVHVVG